jgi:hypothetical protein
MSLVDNNRPTLGSAATTILILAAGLLGQQASAQSYSRTESITYYDHDNATVWQLGQLASVTCVGSTPSSVACDGNDVMSASTFSATNALTLSVSAFGKVQTKFTYDTTSAVAGGQRGTLKTVADADGKTTTYASWKAGVPQSITYFNSQTESAVVDGNGWIRSTTNEVQSKTCLDYDQMGRLTSTTYTSESAQNTCDTSGVAWKPSIRTFVKLAAMEQGVPAGAWRDTVTTGNEVTITYYDALWRPLLVRRYDSASVAATESFVKTTYDTAGRIQFVSYPSSTSSPTKGTWTYYDALGRVTSVSQDSEFASPLVTTTAYVSGFKMIVTNPLLKSTTTSYQTFDQPITSSPVLIQMPQNVTTTIVRDPYGKPLSMTRGTSN